MSAILHDETPHPACGTALLQTFRAASRIGLALRAPMKIDGLPPATKAAGSSPVARPGGRARSGEPDGATSGGVSARPGQLAAVG